MPNYIPAGTCICPICGRTFKEAFYRDSTSRTGALLVRDGILGRYRYRLKPHTTDGREPDDLENVSFDPHQIRDDVMPDSITVQTADNGEVAWKRACIYCQSNSWIPSRVGALPTYLIPVIGNKLQGKSCLLHQLQTPKSITSVNSSRNSNFSLWPGTITNPGVAVAPTVGANGETTFIILKRRNDGQEKDIAVIILRDLAGEVFDPRNGKHLTEEDIHIRDRLIRNSSALMFVSSPDGLNETDIFDDHIGTYAQNTMRPIACVMTHLDKIAAGRFDKNGISFTTTRDNAENLVTLLTPTTFPVDRGMNNAYYAPVTLEKRFALERLIARNYGGVFGVLNALAPDRCGGFLVKSCSVNDADKSQDYREPINAYDPILWLLMKLGLITL